MKINPHTHIQIISYYGNDFLKIHTKDLHNLFIYLFLIMIRFYCVSVCVCIYTLYAYFFNNWRIKGFKKKTVDYFYTYVCTTSFYLLFITFIKEFTFILYFIWKFENIFNFILNNLSASSLMDKYLLQTIAPVS